MFGLKARRAIKHLRYQKKLLDMPHTYKNDEWVGETIYLINKYIGDSEFPEQLKNIRIAEFIHPHYQTPQAQLASKYAQAKRIIDKVISVIQKDGIKKESKSDILLENMDIFLIVFVFGLTIGSIWHPFDKYWVMFVDWLNG